MIVNEKNINVELFQNINISKVEIRVVLTDISQLEMIKFKELILKVNDDIKKYEKLNLIRSVEKVECLE